MGWAPRSQKNFREFRSIYQNGMDSKIPSFHLLNGGKMGEKIGKTGKLRREERLEMEGNEEKLGKEMGKIIL